MSQHHWLKTFFPLNFLEAGAPNQLFINMSTYFWDFSSIPSICIFILTPAPNYLGGYFFAVSFETGKMPSNFVLLPQVYLGLWVPCIFIRLNGQLLQKGDLGFWWRLHWICRCIFGMCLLMHEDGISISSGMFACVSRFFIASVQECNWLLYFGLLSCSLAELICYFWFSFGGFLGIFYVRGLIICK